MDTKEKTHAGNEGLQNGKFEMADNQDKDTIFPPNLKALALAKRAKLRERCPSIPDRSLPKIKRLKDNTANGLTKAIKLAFELAGGIYILARSYQGFVQEIERRLRDGR